MSAESIIGKDGELELSESAYAALMKHVVTVANGEDALHNVVERLLRTPRAAHRGYLLSAVRNASVDIWRADSRRERYEAEYAASASRVAEASPQDGLQAEHLAAALSDAVDTLPELDQALFERRFLIGDSIASIAVDLKLHRSTIEKRLQKIKQLCYEVVSTHAESS